MAEIRAIRKRKFRPDGAVVDLSGDSHQVVVDHNSLQSLELAKRLEAEEREALVKRLEAEESLARGRLAEMVRSAREAQCEEDAAMAARLGAEAAASPSPVASPPRNRRGGRVRERQPRPAANPRGRDRGRSRGMNLGLLGIIMDVVASRNGGMGPFGAFGGQRAQIPPGMDPRLAELMTRDLNANDYETLMGLHDESAANGKGQGASDAELDLMPVFSYGSHKKQRVSSSSSSSSNSSSRRKAAPVVSLLDDSDDDALQLLPPPSSTLWVDEEKKEEKGEKEEDKCAVCLEDFEDGNKCMRLPCLHYFHADCIREWLRVKKSCPSCQKPIDEM